MMNTTKANNISMLVEVINGAENTQQLIDAVKSIRSASKVANYRRGKSLDAEASIENIKKIIHIIEKKHEELLPDTDILKAGKEDGRLVNLLFLLKSDIGC